MSVNDCKDILFSDIAPTVQNVDILDSKTQINMRLINKIERFQNNNTLLPQDFTNITSDHDFDIIKYEAMEFRPRIKWPDLLVQVSLHLVTIYGLYLIITCDVMFLTILFGK